MADTWPQTQLRMIGLQREFRNLKLDRDDVCRRLIRQDVTLNLPLACEAVETILGLRAQVEQLQATLDRALDMLPEEVTDV